MKYSILGFSQEQVCAIKKDVQTDNGNIKHLCLDVVDLLILKDVSDFMNRSKIIKLTIDDKIYFSITHKCILEDLPILGIKKQALKDRIDKMVQLGILDKKVVRDNGGTWVGYRTTKVYEDLIYSNNNEGVYLTTRGGCSRLHEGGVVDYNPNNTITINNNTINNKEEYTNVYSKKNDYQAIIDCWNEYNGKSWGKVLRLSAKRKRIIKSALDNQGITQEELMRLFKTFPYADNWLFHPTKEHKDWKPDFDWWMRDTNGWLTKALEGKVHNSNPQAFNEIMRSNGDEVLYTPQGRSIWFNEETKSYWSMDNFYDEKIYDGYDDNNRPNGATITLNNGRGRIQWDAKSKEWINNK